MAATVIFAAAPFSPSSSIGHRSHRRRTSTPLSFSSFSLYASRSSLDWKLPSLSSGVGHGRCWVSACAPSSSSSINPPSPPAFNRPSKKLYVSGLSFRTTEDNLRNAFKKFGQLVEVNLVMDKIANRPRGFAFLRYATDEEAQEAIEGMHGKFLDGRVIFVEVAKPRSELRQIQKQNPT